MHPVEALLVPLGRALRDRRPDEATSIVHAPGLRTEHRIALRSPAFGDGEVIPAKHCAWLIGENVSPALVWSDLPEGTVDLLLVMEDIDVPGAKPAIHMAAAFAPTSDGLAEGALTPGAPTIRYLPRRPLRHGGYMGPRPLPGHGPHRYRFHLYALDAPVDLAGVAGPDALPAAVEGHVLASGVLMGTRTT